jgi:uncharacterized membrane protein YjgN (DUF898 family)
MNMPCPYALLGIPYHASERDIRRAYSSALAGLRARIGQGGTPEHLDATRAAYLVLSDPARRLQHDAGRLAQDADGATLAADRTEAAYPLTFTGSGKIYFRIWITNLLLSLLTLGIYSAWAKVRREQYFHRHLRIDGVAFDYHARPMAILKGRILFALIVGLFYLTRIMPPAVHGAVVVAGVFLFPWMILRSLQFRAANTSYRSLRFSFHGTYRESLTAYVGYALLTVVTLGLALPLMLWRQKKFVLANLGYGANVLAYHATRQMFFRRLWLPTLLVFLVLAGPIFALLIFKKSFLFVVGMLIASKILVPYLVLLIVFFQLIVFPYVRMAALNIAWSNSRLNDIRFVCDQGFPGYGATHASNWLVMLLSAGLFWPWANVRMLRFRARHFALQAAGSLDEFLAGATPDASALGSEAAASLDFDVAL